MSISIGPMSAAKGTTVLGERLERLTGEEAACCVPGYEAIAQKILASTDFPAALRRVKALADENRLLIVAMLRRRGEMCACEIQAATGRSHATVSHHMSVLVESGLVDPRREGKWMYYRATDRSAELIP